MRCFVRDDRVGSGRGRPRVQRRPGSVIASPGLAQEGDQDLLCCRPRSSKRLPRVPSGTCWHRSVSERRHTVQGSAVAVVCPCFAPHGPESMRLTCSCGTRRLFTRGDQMPLAPRRVERLGERGNGRTRPDPSPNGEHRRNRSFEPRSHGMPASGLARCWIDVGRATRRTQRLLCFTPWALVAVAARRRP
jgi:hypothetical protein